MHIKLRIAANKAAGDAPRRCRPNRTYSKSSNIAEDNLTAAVEWLDGVEKLFALLATQPALGERMETRRFGEVRRHITGSYAIYYRFADDSLQI